MAARERAYPPILDNRVVRAGIVSWAVAGIVGLAGAVLFVLVRPLSVLFIPLAIALVITYLLNPVVTLLERRGMRRGLAVLAIYLIFLAILALVLALLIPVIVRQVSGFVDELPNYAQKAVTEVNEFAERRGFDFRLTPDQIVDAVRSNRQAILGFLGGVRSVAGQILHFLISGVIGMILSIYLLIDLPKIQRAVKAGIPSRYREDVLTVLDRVGDALGGFFRGQLLVATFVGVASAVGLTLVKLPFAVLIGLLAGIFNLVPMIGPFLAAIPAVLVALLSDQPSRALYAGIVLLVVQQIDNHIISPNVMGRTVRLHPVTVMLALLAGGTVAGIFGMLLVIPLVASIKIVAGYIWARRREIGDAIAEPAEP